MPDIKKNLIYQTLYQFLNALIPFALAPYISRVLGAESIGVYSYTSSVAVYFGLFAALGMNHHGSRTIAAVRDKKDELNKTFSDLLFLRLGISLAALAAYGVFTVFFAGEYKVFFAIQAFTVLSSALDINWLFMGLERVKLTVTRNAAVKLSAVFCVFIFVKTPSDLWKYALIMSLGTFGGQAAVWFFIRRFAAVVKPTLSGIKAHIKPVLILFIPVISMSVYNVMDKIMLGAMTDKTQLGFYTNSEKIIFIPVGFITAFNAVMIPRMSNIGAKGNEAEKSRLTLISMRYVMLLSFAVAFGIAAVADRFAPWFFGNEFEDCAILIRGLCLMIPFLAFQNVITAQYLIPTGKDLIYTVSTIAGAAINVAANLVLIPRFGAGGAVIGTIFAEVLRCVIVAFAAKKEIPVGVYIKNSLFFAFAGAAMFPLVYYTGKAAGDLPATILVQVITGAGFYLLSSAVYLYIIKERFFMDNVIKRFFKNH